MMKCDVSVTLCLAVALLCMASGQSLVSAKNVAAMPTPAPLVTSTVKPTSAPKIEAKPTEAVIINVPPKRTQVAEDMKQQQKVAAPIEAMPALKSAEPVQLQSGLRVKDAKPVQVTGFITKSGNIYEIEGKDGIGQIEGRQADDSQTPNVCNYGSIVIYSDVPCDQVTNVQVSGVQQQNANQEPTPVTEQPAAAAAAAAPAEVATPATEASPANAEADKEGDELAGAASVNAPRGQAQRRRQQASNKRRRRNGNKRNKNKRRRVGQNGAGNRRRQQNGQRKRPRPQGQRQKPAKRNQQQKRRRQQQQQRRRRQQQKQQQQQQQRRRQQQQRRRLNSNAAFNARANL